MKRQLAALAVAAPLLAACGATMRTTSTTRVDHLQSSLGSVTSTVRVAPVVSVATSRRADAPSIEVAPQVTIGSTNATRLRLRGRVTGRGPWHPSLSASVDDGVTRTAELAADSLVTLPAVAALHLRQLRATAGVRLDQGRRQQVSVAMDVGQSAGVGAQRAAMPQLSTVAVDARVARILSRHTTLGASLRTASEQVGTAPALLVTRLASTMQWDVSKAVRLSATAGVVSALGSAEPVVELGAGYGRSPAALRLSALVARGPEVDRLSGALTARMRGRIRFETPLVPRVSFGGTLQLAADQGGNAQRVARNGDAGFTIAITRTQTMQIGVARFQQYTGDRITNAETRAFLQLSLAPTR